jgi:putative transcriptional regulator
VAIENTDGLHRAIARRLLDETGHLTGPEFRFLRLELDMSQAALASILGNDAQSIALWEKRSRVPRWADRFMRAIYREAILGKADILSMIERLKGSALHKRLPLRFEETAKGWRAAAA